MDCTIEWEPVNDLPGSFYPKKDFHNHHNCWIVISCQIPYMLLKIGLQNTPTILDNNIDDDMMTGGGELIKQEQ